MTKVIPIHLDFEDTIVLHTCPYSEEIHGDYETLCDCDDKQIQNCLDDI